jgi:hypothetical protein
MDKPVWRARLLALGGVVETMAAMGLLLVPVAAASLLFQSSLDATGVVVARIAGGGLLALGIACWLARNTPSAPASLGVSWAFLAYNVVAGGTLALAGATLPGAGALVLAAALLHGALAVALLALLAGHEPRG